MKILSMYSRGTKLGYMSIDEFATLLKVHSFLGCPEEYMGDNEPSTKRNIEKDLLLENLQFCADVEDEENGIAAEFNVREKADIQSLIKKVQEMTEEQVAELHIALAKADKLFSMFFFVDPIERLTYEKEKADGYEKIVKDSVKIANKAIEISDKTIKSSNKAKKIVDEAIEIINESKEIIEDNYPTSKDLKVSIPKKFMN